MTRYRTRYTKGISPLAMGGLILVVVVAIVGGIYVLSGHVTSNVIGVTPQSTSCPSSAQVLLVSVQYTNFTNMRTSLAGSMPISVYLPGHTIAYASGTSSTTGPTTISGINCNTNYVVGSGDNKEFLANFTTINSGTNVNTPVYVNVLNYTPVTVQFANSTTAAVGSSATYYNAAAGQTITSIVMQIQAGRGFSSEGPQALMLIYNSSAMSMPSIPGATQIASGDLPSPSFTSGQNAYVAYSIPAVNNYAYATVAGPTSSPSSINPTFALKSGFNANTVVSVEVVPQSMYINPSTGNPVSSYINATTDAALVTPKVISSAIHIDIA